MPLGRGGDRCAVPPDDGIGGEVGSLNHDVEIDAPTMAVVSEMEARDGTSAAGGDFRRHRPRMTTGAGQRQQQEAKTLGSRRSGEQKQISLRESWTIKLV